MAVYYGGQKVGLGQVKQVTSYVEVPSGSTINDVDLTDSVNISKVQYDALGKAINYRTGEHQTYNSVNQMINKLNENYFMTMEQPTLKYYKTTAWTRPAGWPNLDSLNLATTAATPDYIYMTYNADYTDSAVALNITGTNIAVSIGHIASGAYVIDENISGTSNNYALWLDNYTGYPIVRVTGTITQCQCYEITKANGLKQSRLTQPIIERYAHIPNLTTFVSNSSSYSWGTYFLEHDKVSNGTGNALTNMGYAWNNCKNLQKLDIDQLYTPKVTSMSSTFSGCYLLKELNLSHWEVNKVTSMNSMFSSDYALVSINLTNWNTIALTSMSSMFSDCHSLETITNIENLNIANVTNLNSVFGYCYNLKSLDLEQWNTSKVTSLSSTFNYCRSLITLKISLWDVSKVTTLSSTFGYCHNLKELDLHNWSTGNLTSLYGTFQYCHSLQKIDVSGFHVTNTCTSINYLFAYCFSLQSLEIPSTWNLSNVTQSSQAFYNCYALKSITGITNWTFTKSTSLSSMFQYCYSLSTLDISGWTVNTINNFSSMFANCYSLQTLNLSNWVPTACTTFSSMFYNCFSLRSVGNINGWGSNTSNVTNFSSMFSGCYALSQTFDLSSWNVAKATTTANMFSSCRALESITIKNWNLAVCTTCAGMFGGCYNLKTVDLGGWTFTSSYKTAQGAFLSTCYQLKNILSISIAPYDISFSSSDMITRESLKIILDALPAPAATRTLTLGTVLKARILDSDKTNPNLSSWTIA